MRILHTEWSGGFGGQEIRILNEMQEMRRRGCHLALATKEDARILPKAKNMVLPPLPYPLGAKPT